MIFKKRRNNNIIILVHFNAENGTGCICNNDDEQGHVLIWALTYIFIQA